jgi:hypothetical protein
VAEHDWEGKTMEKTQRNLDDYICLSDGKENILVHNSAYAVLDAMNEEALKNLHGASPNGEGRLLYPDGKLTPAGSEYLMGYAKNTTYHKAHFLIVDSLDQEISETSGREILLSAMDQCDIAYTGQELMPEALQEGASTAALRVHLPGNQHRPTQESLSNIVEGSYRSNPFKGSHDDHSMD